MKTFTVDKPATQASSIRVWFTDARDHTDTEVVNRALWEVSERRDRLTGWHVQRYADNDDALVTLHRS